MDGDEISLKQKYHALQNVASYRPAYTLFIIVFSFFATLLEAVGLTFLLPVIEAAQASKGQIQQAEGISGLFFQIYSTLGVPFTLENLIIGLVVVMIIRYSSTFVAKWLAISLSKGYEQDFKIQAFDLALDAKIAYYDEKGSDEILNAIITQTRYAGRVIRWVVELFQQILLSVMYAAVALIVAPILMLLAAVFLGGITVIVRYVIEPGYTVGDRVAIANEKIQQHTQAGTQGIRDVKLYGVSQDIFNKFQKSVISYTNSSIDLERNQAGIQSLYQLLTAIMLFGLLYLAISVLSLSIGALGVFLFAMFRLAPRVSNLNTKLYQIEGDLPHLVRTQQFVDRIGKHQEERTSSSSVPNLINRIIYQDVSFSYSEEERVISDMSFEVERGEFVAFVGPSGAGKSTIVSLLARMYSPDTGVITANSIPISEFDVRDWRDKLSMVRQSPYIFNESLRFNITLGKEVYQTRLEKVMRISQVDEFLYELPNGLDTVLGDNGVKLSGGQRQRVALARALVSDSEILILDEATSDLDSNLEKQIHEAIEQLDDERTIFVIAHRLSTVHNADRIYTVESGEITEMGTHKELIKDGGKYAELYGIQS
ncbi:ABC transporter ATP-binding protein [Natronomonas sp. EA1]|uniref:ABC transporter ATP-binding protein n=1 Tax=Natronomonas sp. EA1 TaxID=3421655 RepID=UPI003EB81C9A